MKEQLISFKTAKLAKEKGFDVDNKIYFLSNGKINSILGLKVDGIKKSDCFLAPTQSLLQKWLREVHNIHINVQRTDNSEHCYYQVWVYDAKNEKDNYGRALKISDRGHSETCIYSYEEALEKGLYQALLLL